MRDNAKRMLNRKGPHPSAPQGSRNPIRAAEEGTLRQRCTGPVMHRFRAASRIACPMCQHPTQVLPEVRTR